MTGVMAALNAQITRLEASLDETPGGNLIGSGTVTRTDGIWR